MTRIERSLGKLALTFAVLAVVPLAAQAQIQEIVLHNFPNFPRGANPQAGVIMDAAGKLYGTTVNGGMGSGVVYELDAAGHESVLHVFKGGTDGANPHAGVTADATGNLYGTTFNGGAGGHGTVYKLDAARHETVLYSFSGGMDGGSPYAGVTLDSAGNLYGTAYYGGTANAGVVYKVDATGQETVLYNFGGGTDGANPYAGVIMDSAGNLYGTTYAGGAAGHGSVYKVTPAGHETVLHSFTGKPDGAKPYACVIMDSAGNLYGTTYGGGSSGRGVVYKVDARGQETVLHSFLAGAYYPQAGVILDAAGNFYGTAQGGQTGYGAVYKLDPVGKETVLFNFALGKSGWNPLSGVILDMAGDLYGTTLNGGGPQSTAGVVYKLDTAGQQTVLYTFFVGHGGAQPSSGVIRDSAGNIYGTTYSGGTDNFGVLYKLDAAGNETVLHAFNLTFTDGANPAGNLAMDTAGNVYGAISNGGVYSGGKVYKVDTMGHETILHNFTSNPDGAGPQGVTLDAAGNLYGTAWSGGINYGVVYKLDATGHETILHSFTGGADGAFPMAPVILDSAGNLYGTSLRGGNGGSVFKLDTSGQETVLYSFTGGADGNGPYSGLVFDAAGNLYGTTRNGGAANVGVVYKLDLTGHETVLYSFTGGGDGADPYAGVILDSAGNLYGTTSAGGQSNCNFQAQSGCGTVYKLDTLGNLIVLYSFTGGTDGGNPSGGVIMDASGNIYGATATGGASGGGVVFELKNAVASPSKPLT